LVRNHVSAVVIIAARFVASIVLSDRMRRTGGGRYLLPVTEEGQPSVMEGAKAKGIE
jgi:hypothetical protein